MMYAVPYISGTGHAFLSGIFPPDKLKADLNHQGIYRSLMQMKIGNYDYSASILTNNSFAITGGAALYIYGIKLGSTKP